MLERCVARILENKPGKTDGAYVKDDDWVSYVVHVHNLVAASTPTIGGGAPRASVGQAAAAQQVPACKNKGAAPQPEAKTKYQDTSGTRSSGQVRR